MMIDKVGGIGPNYGPRKTEAATRAQNPARVSDNVMISEEASRAADTARVSKLAKHSADSSRAEKLKEVKTRLANGDYNNLSDEIVDKIAERIADSFLGIA